MGQYSICCNVLASLNTFGGLNPKSFCGLTHPTGVTQLDMFCHVQLCYYDVTHRCGFCQQQILGSVLCAVEFSFHQCVKSVLCNITLTSWFIGCQVKSERIKIKPDAVTEDVMCLIVVTFSVLHNIMMLHFLVNVMSVR